MSVTLAIIIINCIVSFICFNNAEYFNKLAHIPFIESRFGEYSRLITSGFVHANLMHLGINMYVLYQFGTLVEERMGSIMFIIMYLGAILIANIPSYFKQKDNREYIAIGASGAVSATLFSFILFRPWDTLGVFGIIPMPAFVFGLLYLAYEQYASKNMNDNVGHDAHISGAIFGFLFTFILHPSLLANIFDR